MARRDVPRAPLERLTQGFQQFRVLAVALEFHVFTQLEAGPASARSVARKLGIRERPARILLNALASMGLLEKRGDRYRNAPLAARYLVEGRPEFYGPFVTMMDRRLYDAYRHLGVALRTNRAVTEDPALGDMFRTMAADPEMQRLFTDAMHAAGTYWADRLARSYDFSRHRNLLDVGGGSGVYSIAIVRRHRRLRATVWDLEGVVRIARDRIAAANLSDWVTTRVGDFFTDPWPEGHDVVLFSAVLHDWSPRDATRLLRKAHAALPRGGAVVIRELFANDTGVGPLYAAISSVTMLLDTRGENYTWSTYEKWLKRAGFVRPQRIPFRTTAASGALVAHKP